MSAIKEIMRFQEDREINKNEPSWWGFVKNQSEEFWELTVAWWKKDTYGIVDALADITVFALGEMMKLGYNPEKVLEEVAKEINSREGEFVNGKFRKYTTPEAKAKWYKADFKGCKLNET